MIRTSLYTGDMCMCVYVNVCGDSPSPLTITILMRYSMEQLLKWFWRLVSPGITTHLRCVSGWHEVPVFNRQHLSSPYHTQQVYNVVRFSFVLKFACHNISKDNNSGAQTFERSLVDHCYTSQRSASKELSGTHLPLYHYIMFMFSLSLYSVHVLS